MPGPISSSLLHPALFPGLFVCVLASAFLVLPGPSAPSAYAAVETELDSGIDLSRTNRPFSEWLLAAKNGSAMAQFMVARHYEEGKDVARNYKKAATWYDKAAKQGHLDSATFLALMYLEGRGVKRNPEKGLKMIYQSAERGNIRARYHLGRLYSRGIHVTADRVEAYKWFLLAAYVPRTPESFKAKEKMESLKKVLSGEEIAMATQRAKQLQ